MAQLMPLPLTVSCFSKIQIGFTFLVPAHQGSPGKSAVKQVCVCPILAPFSMHIVDWNPQKSSILQCGVSKVEIHKKAKPVKNKEQKG